LKQTIPAEKKKAPEKSVEVKLTVPQETKQVKATNSDLASQNNNSAEGNNSDDGSMASQERKKLEQKKKKDKKTFKPAFILDRKNK
jgi:hypothetical protein